MRKRINGAVTLETAVLVAVFLGTWALTGFSDGLAGSSFSKGFLHWVDCDQYARLAHALISGNVSLEMPVPQELKDLDNPYCFEDRFALGEKGVPMYWDHAFYEGRYYSYFGVVPAVLLFVPYELLTGSWLSTSIAVAVLGVGVVASSSLLIVRVARRFFGDSASVAFVVLSVLMMFAGCNVVYLGFVSRFYSVPILSSLLLTFLGLFFWMGARRAVPVGAIETAPTGSMARVSAWHLAAGSACMALNLGCRPQFMLACFLAIPLFWKEITKERLLFSRAGSKETAAALIPFLAISAPLLAYNFVRFGSVLDFGSSYNLTGFDMTGYSQGPLATLRILFEYTLQPVVPVAEFPFLGLADIGFVKEDPVLAALTLLPVGLLVGWVVVSATRWLLRKAKQSKAFRAGLAVVFVFCGGAALKAIADVCFADDPHAALSALGGFYPREPMFGGYVWLVPCSLLLLALPRVGKVLRSRGLWGFSLLSILFAAIVLVVDARVAGVTLRYFGDFGWYVMLVCVFTLLSLQARGKEEGSTARKCATLAVGVSALLAISLVLGTLSLFSPLRYDSVAEHNPALYSSVRGLFP